MPNPYLISKKQYQNLKNWIAAGGTLVTEARFGLKDENAHLYPKPLLEELIGITYDHGEITEDGFLDVLEGYPKKYQIIERKLGRGKIVYANFSLFLIIKKGASKWQSTGTLIREIKNML